jgi:hypothetical protein
MGRPVVAFCTIPRVLPFMSPERSHTYRVYMHALLHESTTSRGNYCSFPNPGDLESGTWKLEFETWNLEPGIWNLKPETRKLYYLRI